MELISVIVPIYNSEEYINQSILSIINQTYENLEIILINDGSTDNSLNIMKQYEIKDSRIKVYSHQNFGQSYTRNKGIQVCSGEYIVFLDSDDWLEEHFIEKMYQILSNGAADIAVCNYLISYPNSKRKMSFNFTSLLAGNKAFEQILEGNISHTCWGKMYRASLIKNSEIIFPVGRTNEDLYTVSLWFLKANEVIFSEDFLMISRNREGSITNTFSNNFIDLIYILNMLRSYLLELNIFDEYEQKFRKKYQKMVIYLINYGARMKNMNFIKDVLEKSDIEIKEFDVGLLTTREKIAVNVLKFNTRVYYIIIRLYYYFYVKEINIIT